MSLYVFSGSHLRIAGRSKRCERQQAKWETCVELLVGIASGTHFMCQFELYKMHQDVNISGTVTKGRLML